MVTIKDKSKVVDDVAKSAFITSVFYLVVLVVVAVYAVSMQSYYKNKIADIESQNCWECCKNETFSLTICNHCNLSRNVCSLLVNRSFAGPNMYSEAEIEKIVEDEQRRMLEHWKIDEVGKALKEDKKYKDIKANLYNTVIGTLRRPAAHLTCKHSSTYLQPSGSYQYIREWQTGEGAGTVFVEGIRCNSTTGQVTITKPGKYSIHLHTSFEKQRNTTKGNCEFVQEVNLLDRATYKLTRLLEASKLFGCECDTNRRETLDSSVVRELNEHDTLEVRLKMPEHTKLLKQQHETYFDVIMV